MAEQILCVSYFDQVIGPNIFYSNEDIAKDPFKFPDIKRILEFQDLEGSFIFAFRKYQTINHIFYIDSKYARGGQELLMITYMIKAAFFKNEIENIFNYLQSKTPLLKNFARDIGNLRDLPELLHSSKGILGKQQVIHSTPNTFKADFLRLYNKYIREIYIDEELHTSFKPESELKKIYLIGPPKVGKKTFLRNIEEIQFRKRKNTDLTSRIYEFLVENIEIITHNGNGENSKFDLAQKDIDFSEAQAFIIILDLCNKDLYKNARDMYNTVLKKIQKNPERKVPVLILGNEFNGLNGHDRKLFFESLKFKELEESHLDIKFLEMDLKHNDKKNMKAFRWLAQHIL